MAILDAKTLAVTREDKVPASLRSSPLGMKPTAGSITPAATSPCAALDVADFLSNGKKAGWRVDRSSNGGSDRAHVVNGKHASAESYLRPCLVGSDDPPLLFHHTSLDAAHDSLQLSRLTPSAATAWTVDVKRPSCENAGTSGALFVVTTDDAQRRALGIDPSAGAVKWVVSAKW